MVDPKDEAVFEVVCRRFWAEVREKAAHLSEFAKAVTDREIEEAQQQDEELRRFAEQVVASDAFWAGVARRKARLKVYENDALRPVLKDVPSESIYQMADKYTVPTLSRLQVERAALTFTEDGHHYWESAFQGFDGLYWEAAVGGVTGLHTDDLSAARVRKRVRERRQARRVDSQQRSCHG